MTVLVLKDSGRRDVPGAIRGSQVGHGEASEIDHTARRQFECAATRDDLTLIERQRRHAIKRHALAPGIGVIVRGTIGL